MTPSQLALETGVSRQTIDRARREGRLPAVPYGRGYAFRRTEIVEIGDLRNGDIRKHTNSVMRAQYEGERDAKVIGMLEQGSTTAEIVVECKVSLSAVMVIRQAWIRARDAERRETAITCRCGGVADQRAAMCMSCFGRARPLSDAQLALLSGQPPPAPNTCTCRGCGAVVSNEAADHWCRPCAGRLTIEAPDGVPAVLFAGTVVRTLSLEEGQHLAAQIAHLMVAGPTPAAGTLAAQLAVEPEVTIKRRPELDELLEQVRERMESKR